MPLRLALRPFLLLWWGCLPIFAAVACGRASAPPPELQVLTWSGQDQACLALDQPLRVQFSAPLRTPLRPGAVTIVDEGGNPVPRLRVRVDGSYLQILPALPRLASLQDGSLQPGLHYAIRLAGIPSLSALQGADGSSLRGDWDLPFFTCAATDPAALIGLGASQGSLGLFPGQLQGDILSLRPGQALQLRFQGGLDPRSLAPAQLRSTVDGDEQAVPMYLVDNDLEEATLALELGDWQGWGVLSLPASLEGLGGRPLAPKLQQIRIHR